MGQSAFDILSLIVSIITPVMILILGWIYTSNQKKTEKIEKLENKVDDTEAGKLKKQLATIEDLCKANSSAVDAINRVIREISTQQNQLQISNKINGKCTRELAYLVTALSEGLRDNHLDGNITSAVNRYKKFEHEILGQIMTGDDS
jgi:ABC-type Na+ efflux pump permease subunit